jgi:hypothetical protein
MNPFTSVEPAGNPVSVFPLVVVAMQCWTAWGLLANLCNTLSRREVVELEEQVAWPVSESLQVRECTEE